MENRIGAFVQNGIVKFGFTINSIGIPALELTVAFNERKLVDNAKEKATIKITGTTDKFKDDDDNDLEPQALLLLDEVYAFVKKRDVIGVIVAAGGIIIFYWFWVNFPIKYSRNGYFFR